LSADYGAHRDSPAGSQADPSGGLAEIGRFRIFNRGEPVEGSNDGSQVDGFVGLSDVLIEANPNDGWNIPSPRTDYFFMRSLFMRTFGVPLVLIFRIAHGSADVDGMLRHVREDAQRKRTNGGRINRRPVRSLRLSIHWRLRLGNASGFRLEHGSASSSAAAIRYYRSPIELSTCTNINPHEGG
jgi:hypothetical protein